LKSICIPSSVEILCSECFGGCSSLSSLTFESDSKLAQIQSKAFSGCAALTSICIPQGIQQLEFHWSVGSSLAIVVFESSGSLQAMIEQERVDLEGHFDIVLVDWDGVLSFPGYSVCTIPGVDDSVRLVKNE
jgi:hypothetical protein